MQIAEDLDSLVQDAQSGSAQAFGELVRLHQANVRRFLARFTQDASIVDDLAQEVFLTAYRKLEDFRNESKFSTWLFGIAKNKALHFLRSERRRKAKEKKSFEAALLNWQATVLEPESESDQESFLESLDECIRQLSPVCQEVVNEYYFHEKSTDAIASKVNKGSGAVRMMLVRIRRALLKCITRKKKLLDNID
ncbi:MAG: RNA polymerase sigma factor [Planctomycetota bacterium]